VPGSVNAKGRVFLPVLSGYVPMLDMFAPHLRYMGVLFRHKRSFSAGVRSGPEVSLREDFPDVQVVHRCAVPCVSRFGARSGEIIAGRDRPSAFADCRRTAITGDAPSRVTTWSYATSLVTAVGLAAPSASCGVACAGC
jgi:hypothetical protein